MPVLVSWLRRTSPVPSMPTVNSSSCNGPADVADEPDPGAVRRPRDLPHLADARAREQRRLVRCGGADDLPDAAVRARRTAGVGDRRRVRRPRGIASVPGVSGFIGWARACPRPRSPRSRSRRRRRSRPRPATSRGRTRWRRSVEVRLVLALPSAFITYRSPLRTNAIRDPSGDHAGSVSFVATAGRVDGDLPRPGPVGVDGPDPVRGRARDAAERYEVPVRRHRRRLEEKAVAGRPRCRSRPRRRAPMALRRRASRSTRES